MEHRLGGVEGGRLARAHDTVDVEQRTLAGRVLVHGKRVADVGTDIDVIDIEHRQLDDADLFEALQELVRDLVAGLGPDLAGLLVDEILGDVLADQILVRGLQEVDAALGDLPGIAGVELLAGLEHDFAGLGIDEIDRSLEVLEALGIVGHAPVGAVAVVDHAVVEG